MHTVLVQLFILVVLFPQIAASVEMPKGEFRPAKTEKVIQWQYHWQQARIAGYRGDYTYSAELYEQTLRERPEIQLARWEYCQLAFSFDDLEKAEALITRLLEQAPNEWEYRFFIAELYNTQGRLKESERIYVELYQHSTTQKENLLALEKLISVYLAQGKQDAALPLVQKILQYHPESVPYRKKLARLFLERGQFNAIKEYTLLLEDGALTSEEAIEIAGESINIPMSRWLRASLYEFYLEEYPQDRLTRQELGFLYNDLGLYEKALDHFLILSGMPYVDYKVYREIAETYNERLGRPDKALLYYEKYRAKSSDLAISAEIERIQTLLAIDFTVLLENGGGEQLWTDLNAITGNPQNIFLEIAKGFRRSGKRDLALEALTYIEKEAPKGVPLEVVEELLKLNEPESALIALKNISLRSRDANYYKIKIETEARLGHAYVSYQDRLELLAVAGPNGVDGQNLLEETLRYSSLSGLRDVLANYPELLENHQNRLAAAQIYSNNALFSRADALLHVEHEMLTDEEKEAEDLLRAESYRLQFLRYEAEQLYRQLLLKKKFPAQVIAKLMELSFVEGEIEHTALWYQFIKIKYAEISDTDQIGAMEMALDVLHAQFLLYDNDPKGAQQLLSERQSIVLDENLFSKDVQKKNDQILCQSSLLIEPNSSCETTGGDQGVSRYEYLYKTLSKPLLSKIPDSLLLTRAERSLLFEELDDVNLVLLELNKRNIKTSYTKILNARFLVLSGNYTKAVPVYKELVKSYPDESFFKVMLASTEGKLGQYQNEHEILESLPSFLPINSLYTTKISLQNARNLWRLNQKDAALLAYKSLQDELAQKLESIEGLPDQYFKTSYWQEVATLFDHPKNSLDRIMDPTFLLTSPPTTAINEINNLYSSYRWHRLVDREYQARHAAYQKRLVMAERNYRMLLEEKEAEGIMPDLAPIYQRLGDYEREAKVYQDVQESGVNIDYLAVSIDENQKQLQPKLDSFFHFSNRDGRGGSIDMKKYQTGTDFGFTPELGQEYHFSYVLTQYNGGSKSQVGHLLASSAQLNVYEDFNLDLGLGFEKTNHGGDLSTFGKVVLNYRVLDHLRSYVGWNRGRVDDTIDSVNEDLLAQNINLGAVYESPKGLDLGIEYIYRFLSDSNEQELVNAWTEYTLFSDQAELGVRYDFEFFSGKNVGKGLPYWNPDDFRKQSFSLSFRYNLNEEREGEKALERYYEIATRLGVEDDDNISYTTEFDIFLEMTPQFLLKGSLLYSKSDDYDESAGLLHLIYRW